jgi:aminopeptidase N
MRRSTALALVLVVACSSPAVPMTDSVTVPTLPPSTTLSVVGIDAAPGIGDRMFPELGNAGFDVIRYEIDLSFDGLLTTVEGIVAIEAIAEVALSSFALDFVGHTVELVEVDGRSAAYDRGPRDMRITPVEPIPAHTSFRVVVAYHGSPEPVTLTDFPFPTGWQRGDSGSLFLFSQPDGASGVFPANDHPRDRADVSLRVSVPSPFVVVSGGRAHPVETDGDLSVYRFEIPDVAPYLIPLAIGSFEPLTTPDGVVTWMGEGAPLPPGFDRQLEILGFMESDLGPYPFESSGAVVVSSDFPAALETQTLSTYTTASAAWGEAVIAHELAHQWFGNEIGLGQWDDIWLNEGFSTFMTWRWIEYDQGRDRYEAELRRAWNSMAAADVPAPDFPPGQELFHVTVYLRGGLAVAALRDFVGDDEFFGFLRSYVAAFSGKTVTTEAFLTFVLIVLGPSAEELVIDWIRNPEIPPLWLD